MTTDGTLRRNAVIVGCWIALLSSHALSHPNHDAVAEADWNADTRSLEMSMRLNAHELERAVSEASGKAIDLDDMEAAATPLKAYVEKHLRCLKPDGSSVKLKWAGAEIKVRSAWLYFEFPLGSGTAIEDCELSNTVFFERFEDQKNTIALRLTPDNARRFLRFSKEQPVVKVHATTAVEVSPDPSVVRPPPEKE